MAGKPFQPGDERINRKGRPVGTGRLDQYRKLFDPHVPELLKVLVEKARGGDLAAMKLILERVYPLRDVTTAELMGEIDDLRRIIEERQSA